MAGEFGRAVTNLGVGLMERSQRKKELEEQRRFQKEQRKQEEEAYMRKQAYLAKLQAEQKAQEKAEKLEREKQGDIKIGRSGEVIRTFRNEDGTPGFETLRAGTQSAPSVQTRTFNGKVNQLMSDGTWKPIGDAPNPPAALSAADMRGIEASAEVRRYAEEIAALEEAASDPTMINPSDRTKLLQEAAKLRGKLASAEARAKSYGGLMEAGANDTQASVAPLREDKALMGEPVPQPQAGRQRIGDAALSVDREIVEANDPMLANAYQIAMDRLRERKQKEQKPITAEDYRIALAWAKANKDRVKPYFEQE